MRRLTLSLTLVFLASLAFGAAQAGSKHGYYDGYYGYDRHYDNRRHYRRYGEPVRRGDYYDRDYRDRGYYRQYRYYHPRPQHRPFYRYNHRPQVRVHLHHYRPIVRIYRDYDSYMYCPDHGGYFLRTDIYYD